MAAPDLKVVTDEQNGAPPRSIEELICAAEVACRELADALWAQQRFQRHRGLDPDETLLRGIETVRRMLDRRIPEQ